MTMHSIQRTMERAKLSRKSAQQMIQLAQLQGRSADNFTDRERNYLLRKIQDGKHAVSYAGFCFVFSEDGVCVTMFPQPEWFERKRESFKVSKCRCDGKIRVRNPKKYFTRYNNFFAQ